jgi:uncharacterized repeat protein (TIGR03803 family)
VFCGLLTLASAQTFTTLASFQYDGANPEYVSLIQANDGNFYGTTRDGGGGAVGVVFKVTPAGELRDLTDFSNTRDGYPYAGVVQAADGNFYGTTWQRGTQNAGTAFEVTSSGTLTVLYSFCSENNCADGDEPLAPLIQGTDQNFYGTTADGGTKGYGTVFKLSMAGALTTLHNFRFKDGASPVAGLIRAKNGKFYGTTLFGGTKGGGAVFEMTAAGKLKTLYSFCQQKKCTDGTNPYAGLVQAADGSFYGTTYAGGAHGHGTVFRVTAAGKLTTLYSFCSQKRCSDGAYPYAGVIHATDGNFYGTTSQGGTSNWGTIYKVSSTGQWAMLHRFCAKKNCTDGADPSGGLLQATSGIFYGTTTYGGISQEGTVYSLSMGLAPRH